MRLLFKLFAYVDLLSIFSDIVDDFSDPRVANRVLRVHTITIKEADLNLSLLTDKLFSVYIISEDEKRDLNDELTGKTTTDRIGKLLDIIRNTAKNNGKVFPQFISILNKGSQREKDLAKILIDTYKGDNYIKKKILSIT